MRKTIVTCDICGEDEESGRIGQYYMVEPHMYRVGHAPLERPGKQIDAHESCYELAKKLMASAWLECTKKLADIANQAVAEVDGEAGGEE